MINIIHVNEIFFRIAKNFLKNAVNSLKRLLFHWKSTRNLPDLHRRSLSAVMRHEKELSTMASRNVKNLKYTNIMRKIDFKSFILDGEDLLKLRMLRFAWHIHVNALVVRFRDLSVKYAIFVECYKFSTALRFSDCVKYQGCPAQGKSGFR